MNALLLLSDTELMEAADLTDAEFDEVENQLALRAACLGWTGDPMRQPLGTVAGIAREVIARRYAPPPSSLNHPFHQEAAQ